MNDVVVNDVGLGRWWGKIVGSQRVVCDIGMGGGRGEVGRGDGGGVGGMGGGKRGCGGNVLLCVRNRVF